jgi:chromate transport protein ChrA
MVDCGSYLSDGGDVATQAEQRLDERANGVTSATQRVLPAFVRASTLHIGSAAATAALRHELVESHGVEPHEIDGAYAVSRVTPGTNLLALYALLGHRLGGWKLAVQAVAVGAFVPASEAVLVAFLYTQSTSSLVAAMMTGARAGGVAVFLGAAVRLLRPQLSNRPRVAMAVAAGTFLVGHKTESIYRRYAIVDEAMQRQAAARLDAWMAIPPAAPPTAPVAALVRRRRVQRRFSA